MSREGGIEIVVKELCIRMVHKYFMEAYGRKTYFIHNGVNRLEIREANLLMNNFGLKKAPTLMWNNKTVS